MREDGDRLGSTCDREKGREKGRGGCGTGEEEAEACVLMVQGGRGGCSDVRLVNVQ